MKAIDNLIIYKKNERMIRNLINGMSVQEVSIDAGMPATSAKSMIKADLNRLYDRGYLKKTDHEFLMNSFKVYDFAEAVRLNHTIILNALLRMFKAKDYVLGVKTR